MMSWYNLGVCDLYIYMIGEAVHQISNALHKFVSASTSIPAPAPTCDTGQSFAENILIVKTSVRHIVAQGYLLRVRASCE